MTTNNETLETRALDLISKGVNRPAPLARALCVEPKSLKPVLASLRSRQLVTEENGKYSVVQK